MVCVMTQCTFLPLSVLQTARHSQLTLDYYLVVCYVLCNFHVLYRSLRTKNRFETFTLFSRVTLIRKLQSTPDLDHM